MDNVSRKTVSDPKLCQWTIETTAIFCLSLFSSLSLRNLFLFGPYDRKVRDI